MKIFNKLFGRTNNEEVDDSVEIKKMNRIIKESAKTLDTLKLKKQQLEDEVIPSLVKEYYFVDKNYFLPDMETMRYLNNLYCYFVTNASDNSESGKLTRKLQNIQYDIHRISKYIEYIENKIQRYYHVLPAYIRQDKLEKLNHNKRKRIEKEKHKYTKYEIKRRKLIRNQ